jgi:hypothetical protein
MENVIVKDTMKAFIKDIDTGKVYYLGATSSSSINQSINQEFLRGDFGNKIVGKIDSDKTITFTVTPAMHSDNIIQIQSGKYFTTGTSINIPRSESLKVSSGTVTLDGTPAGDVSVFDQYGESLTATETTGTVTITGATDGDVVTVYYEEASSTVQVLDLAVDSFPTNYEVKLIGIAYQPMSNVVVADFYYLISNAVPDGAIDRTYEAGSNSNNPITFTAMDDGTGSYGKYIVAKRA